MTISRMKGPFGIGVNAISKLRLRGTTEASKLLLGLSMCDVLMLCCGLGGPKGRRSGLIIILFFTIRYAVMASRRHPDRLGTRSGLRHVSPRDPLADCLETLSATLASRIPTCKIFLSFKEGRN